MVLVGVNTPVPPVPPAETPPAVVLKDELIRNEPWPTEPLI
jgi:hypothetical protein